MRYTIIFLVFLTGCAATRSELTVEARIEEKPVVVATCRMEYP